VSLRTENCFHAQPPPLASPTLQASIPDPPALIPSGYSGVPRSTLGYSGAPRVPRCTPVYLGVPRGTAGHSGGGGPSWGPLVAFFCKDPNPPTPYSTPGPFGRVFLQSPPPGPSWGPLVAFFCRDPHPPTPYSTPGPFGRVFLQSSRALLWAVSRDRHPPTPTRPLGGVG
jgi:hypothetical protein